MTTSLGCVPLVPNVNISSFYCILFFPGDVKESVGIRHYVDFCNFRLRVLIYEYSFVSHLHQLKSTDCYHPSKCMIRVCFFCFFWRCTNIVFLKLQSKQ